MSTHLKGIAASKGIVMAEAFVQKQSSRVQSGTTAVKTVGDRMNERVSYLYHHFPRKY